MAPQLGVQGNTKNDNPDTDSNSSGSEEGDSSSDEDSSDSDMETGDLFTATSATTIDQTRNPSSVMSTAEHPTETIATVNSTTNSVASAGPTVVNRPPTSMKRLRNMFAAVKPPDSNINTTVNATAVQPLCPEAVTPVTPISTSFDVKSIASPHTTVTATTVTCETKNAPSLLQLPRKSTSKRITSIGSKKSALSEESSSDSEGEESGEVTNSDSEDEATKPKQSKQAKWDITSTVVTPETDKLQLLCSIPRQYMRTMTTPVTTPKSAVSQSIRH